jgi:hypothetical protein
VYDAIKRGYAKTLFFGISTDKDGLHLLEVSMPAEAVGAVQPAVALLSMR